MTPTDAEIHRRCVLSTVAVFLAGCTGEAPGAETDQPATATETAARTTTRTPEPAGWSVHVSYDGDWQGSVSVTTDAGDSHQAYDAEGTKVVDIEPQLGVETRAVQDIVVTAQKMGSGDRTLQVTIRNDGDVVAQSSTDASRGQVMVSHHDEPEGRHGTTDTEPDTETDTDTDTETEPRESAGWSVHFAYDGSWQGTVSVTTDAGDSHQAFDGEGAKTVDVEGRMGVDTQAVQDIVVQAQKMVSDRNTLHVAIRKDGDVVAEDSTDVPRGQVMVSYHV